MVATSPEGQGEHTVEPVRLLVLVPIGQSEPALVVFGQKEPAGQTMQLLDPATVVYVPFAHLAHSDAPMALLLVPTGHGVAVRVYPVQKDPAGHSVQPDVALNRPGLHNMAAVVVCPLV